MTPDRAPRLSAEQKRALDLLRASRHPGVVTVSRSALIDGQPWIHWRTAYALHDKGLVRVVPLGDPDAEVVLDDS